MIVHGDPHLRTCELVAAETQPHRGRVLPIAGEASHISTGDI
jgi:hypothetical protein